MEMVMETTTSSHFGILTLESWAGRTNHPVEILGETPKRYKVKLMTDNIKGRKGTVLKVPKYAVRLVSSNEMAESGFSISS